MEFRYQQGEAQHVVRIIQKGDGYEAQIGERRYEVRAQERDGHTLELLIDGRYVRAKHAEEGKSRWVAVGGVSAHANRLLHRRQRRARGSGSGSLAATMPGQVTGVMVEKGDRVEAGQLLVLMEAMKMELRITAPNDGTVSAVHVATGEQVERGQMLVEMDEGGNGST